MDFSDPERCPRQRTGPEGPPLKLLRDSGQPPFLQVADYYLVAQAHAHDHTVVTHEVVAHSTKRIKIPNACLGMGVRCVTPFEMLRTEGARFVLAGA